MELGMEKLKKMVLWRFIISERFSNFFSFSEYISYSVNDTFIAYMLLIVLDNEIREALQNAYSLCGALASVILRSSTNPIEPVILQVRECNALYVRNYYYNIYLLLFIIIIFSGI